MLTAAWVDGREQEVEVLVVPDKSSSVQARLR